MLAQADRLGTVTLRRGCVSQESDRCDMKLRTVSEPVESAWSAVPVLPLARLSRLLAEPGVPVSEYRALHGFCPSLSDCCETWDERVFLM